NVPHQQEFPVALRLQETWTKDLLPSQNRRFNTLAIAISTANFGKNDEYSYFARYMFGSQGAAGSTYYGFLQHVAPQTGLFARPELFATANIALSPELQVGLLGLNGKRAFTSRSTGAVYSDVYYRDGIEAMWTSPSRRFEAVGQQLWGHDDNTDGFGAQALSS